MSRIIIADDNRVSVLMFKSIVDFLGHEPVTCKNGLEALNEFEKNPADLVILDVNMPEMDGIEACRKIRRLPKGGMVPIIIISGMDEEEDIANGLNAGANDYLLKPVKDSQLLAKLKIFLRMSSLHNDDFELAKNHLVFSGRYKIVKLLGYGTHSVVFLAEDVEDGNRKIALKLFKESAEVTEIYESFAQTAAKLRTIDSPHILKLRDFGQCDRRLFVAMDYAEKGDLARIIKGRCLSQKEAALLGLHISRGINEIAALGIVHFDIKPENIMICGGNYMLADFGIISTRASLTVSVKKEIWGTLAYLPPEYLTEEELHPGKSDIYSLGVTLYQALTGENPFYSDRPASTMFSQVNLIPPELITLNPEFDRELSDLIASMLLKRPEGRPGIDAVMASFEKLFKSFENNIRRESPVPLLKPVKEKPHSDVMDIALSVPEIGTADNARGKAAIPPEWQDTPKRRASPRSSHRSFKMPEWNIDLSFLKIYIRNLAIVAGLLLLGFGIMKLVPKFNTEKVKAEDAGVLSVIKCINCGHILEKKIFDIEEEKCPLCSSPMATAFECNSCGNIFAFKCTAESNNASPKSGKDPYRCPKCGSLDTVPVATSQEYLKKKFQ